jgi:hypothetical protein
VRDRSPHRCSWSKKEDHESGSSVPWGTTEVSPSRSLLFCFFLINLASPFSPFFRAKQDKKRCETCFKAIVGTVIIYRCHKR